MNLQKKFKKNMKKKHFNMRNLVLEKCNEFTKKNMKKNKTSQSE